MNIDSISQFIREGLYKELIDNDNLHEKIKDHLIQNGMTKSWNIMARNIMFLCADNFYSQLLDKLNNRENLKR